MRKEIRKYILSVCLLALYVLFQAGTSVFPHSHILNGEKLVHSHPYSNANHEHTSDQAVTIARLSTVQATAVETAFAPDLELPLLYALEFSMEPFILKAPFTHCVSLRAPPFC